MNRKLCVLLPLALIVSACTQVEPAFKDIGTRNGPCAEGGPDKVAQQFYDLRMQQPLRGRPDSTQLARYRPYLSDGLYRILAERLQHPATAAKLPAGDLFSSNTAGPTSAEVYDASRILNTDARNIPLRVAMSRQRGDSAPVRWRDEVLMIREGHCWAIDDVRYLGPMSPWPAGTLRQSLAER
ncbi:lipoprotein [Martelella alba]|uniref:Lipoprotein n=1 Tax=Martelella alba TaxID=2590451 RepID=A0ABY2SQ98_9HYPH|nr:lipoprotein [Martelella alba]TKI07462.1 lipoprotein [Martelella alba]